MERLDSSFRLNDGHCQIEQQVKHAGATAFPEEEGCRLEHG